MKKVIFVFSLAFGFILFSAFTPSETVTTDLEIVDLNASTALVGTGRLTACYVAGGPATVTYRLYEQNGPGNVAGNGDCSSSQLTLAMGEWEVYAISDIPAYVVFTYDFCGVQGQFGRFHPGGSAEILINNSFYIPC